MPSQDRGRGSGGRFDLEMAVDEDRMSHRVASYSKLTIESPRHSWMWLPRNSNLRKEAEQDADVRFAEATHKVANRS